MVVTITLSGGALLGAAHDGLSSIPGNDHLEGALAQLARLDGDQQRVRAQRYGLSVADSRVRVVIEPTDDRRPASLANGVEALGGRQVLVGERLVSAEVPIDRLQALARRPGVAFVRRPLTARPLAAESLTRYASATLPTGARLMHSHGIRGHNVRVAVIDQGFAQLERYISRGWIDRDAVVDRIDVSGEGMAKGGKHGTRVARVVHTMAPQAELVLINLGKSTDEVALEQAIDRALDQNVDIVNHSIGWFGSNFGDGTGPVDALVRDVRERGVLWVNAAGNQARQHWIGQAVDRDGDGWVEFRPGRDYLYVGSVPSGGDGSITFGGTFGRISLTLVWDQFPTTGQDLNLHLFNARDERVAVADAPQRGFDPPREELQYLVKEPGIFKLKVKAAQLSRPVDLQLFSLEPGHTLTPNVPYSSVVAPADCECALAVGAMNLRDWDRGRIAPYSA
ncbi:MAG: S8 family serine peptidase, partial [Candidatus Bipolaricaulia bacterium]